jgi:2,4-dienoyl-CoA reductase-like NADH-dependent reductase (Old Yellow Enzyme family)
VAIGSVGVPQAFRGEDEERAATLSLAPLLELFERGEFDLIALERALLSDPAWPSKLRDGRLDEISPYDKADESLLT